ncbi:hypothetical protein HZ996_00200 [Cryomorphaceae bacterium]|nr:hypothetical protein HZ996_00200 [Cryomorphaceae bacterium]
MKTLFSLLALMSFGLLAAQNSTVLPEFIVCTDGQNIHIHVENAEVQWVNCDTGEEIAEATQAEFSTGTNGYFSAIVTINGRAYQSVCYEVNGWPEEAPVHLPAQSESLTDQTTGSLQ